MGCSKSIKTSGNKCFLDFLARAYSKNGEGQDLLLKEYLSDSGGGQHCAAQSSKELPSASQDLSAHGSPSLNQSQEIKVSIIYMTKDPFNLCCKLRVYHFLTNSV